MPAPIPARLALAATVLGMFSMGFQLLGSRLLSPWFGSSIIVWAFLISFFLAAFSAGSLLGAVVARLGGADKQQAVFFLAVFSTTAFAFSAAFAQGILGWIDTWTAPLPLALTAACGLLFFPQVCSLSAFTPVMIQRLSETGRNAGFSSGFLYCVGTLGNIAGIMVTVFVLLPLQPVSVLLCAWTTGVGGMLFLLVRWLRG